MARSQHSTALHDTDKLQQLSKPRIAIAYTEWNDAITSALVEGCLQTLEPYGASVTHIAAVPGSFELPFACRKIWEKALSNPDKKPPEAIIAFGAVIRGGTPHFEYVCKAVTEGIAQLNLTLSVPVIFGVLTLDDEAQAWERLGGIHGHKGVEAAITALKMIHFCR